MAASAPARSRPPLWPPGAGDLWGGLAALMVGLPAAIGFGVSVYAPLGPGYALHGAYAGLVGTVALGLLAASLGGTARLISAPCAPAAALLAAFVGQLHQQGNPPERVLLLLALLGVATGGLQMLLGRVGAGRLIRFIPYPVVSGYLTGVGLTLILDQWPHLVAPGLARSGGLEALRALDPRALLIGGLTAASVILAAGRRGRLPAPIVGLTLGLLSYGLLALLDPRLRQTAGNALVLGALPMDSAGLLREPLLHWRAALALDAGHLRQVLASSLTLAALLSVDTLKTCAALDQLTRSHHQPDRELVAQGWANAASALLGGLNGAGTAAPTMLALQSGASTRAVGLVHGLLALLATLLLAPWLGGLPLPMLAGLLVAVGWLMIDREPLRYLRSPATVLDFGVVAVVVLVSLASGLIAAAAVGVLLSMLLFVRGQSAAPLVRHRLGLAQTPSTWHRPRAERERLQREAQRAVVLQLQGSLFFGNARRLAQILDREAEAHRYLLVDLTHVPGIDVTAMEMVLRYLDTLRETDAQMVLCGVSPQRVAGHHLAVLLDTLRARDPDAERVQVVPELDDAIAWVEEQLLHEGEGAPAPAPPLAFEQIELLAGLAEADRARLAALLELRRVAAGEAVYAAGSAGDEIFWVRSGLVRLMATVDAAGRQRQVAGFGRGDAFGGLAFLDGEGRPNTALAVQDSELYVLTRSRWQQLLTQHPALAFEVQGVLARTLASRLRRTQSQLLALQEQ